MKLQKRKQKLKTLMIWRLAKSIRLFGITEMRDILSSLGNELRGIVKTWVWGD